MQKSMAAARGATGLLLTGCSPAFCLAVPVSLLCLCPEQTDDSTHMVAHVALQAAHKLQALACDAVKDLAIQNDGRGLLLSGGRGRGTHNWRTARQDELRLGCEEHGTACMEAHE